MASSLDSIRRDSRSSTGNLRRSSSRSLIVASNSMIRSSRVAMIPDLNLNFQPVDTDFNTFRRVPMDIHPY